LDRLALLVAPLAVGIAVGYGRGGRLRHLAAVRLRGLWLLWVAAGLQAVQFHVEPVRRLVQESVGIPMRVLVYAIPLAWFAGYARHVPRALLLSAGVALGGMACNALPIALNGRMPYVGEAARLAGVPGHLTSKHPPATTDTVLVTLGDVIPVPGIHAVVSIGDLLLLAGIAASIVVLMLPRSAAATDVATHRVRTPGFAVGGTAGRPAAEGAGRVGQVHGTQGSPAG
jgi:hypothetical protein